jgi:hypothetical protein
MGPWRGGPLRVGQSYTMIYVYELEGGVVQVYTAGQFYTLTIVAGYTVLPGNGSPTAPTLRLRVRILHYGYFTA